MWGFIAQVGIWAGLYVANYLLRPKVPKPKPLTKDNLNLPRTEEGSVIPVVYGRCRVTAPALVWTGDLESRTLPIGDAFVITYGLDMLFVVGVPMTGATSQSNILNPSTPKLYNVWYGDKKLPGKGLPRSPNGVAIHRAADVTRPDFHGGLGSGGGIFGTYEWWWGSPDTDLLSPPSPIGDRLLEFYGGDATKVPSYQNQMLVSFLDHYGDIGPYAQRHTRDGQVNPGVHPSSWSIGESGSIEGFSFEVGTYGSGDPSITSMPATGYGYDFRGGADPVMCIYDILTASWSRIGLDPSVIDKPSFRAASDVLKVEQHGFSHAFSDSEDGAEMVGHVLKQIDATLFEDPETGKLTLWLIRAEDPSSIPVFREANIHEVEDYGIGSWHDAVNEVRVTYLDRSREYTSAIAIARSIGNSLTNANRRNSVAIEYPGITDAVTAAAVAARELNVLSRPLKKIALVVDRTGYKLRPGKTFKVYYGEYKIDGVVFRCQSVDYGQLFDNKITIEAVEDAFATPYAGQQPPIFQPTPPQVPYPLVPQLVTESPYWLAHRAKNLGYVNDQNVPRLIAVGAPSINAVRYATYSREQPLGGASSKVFNPDMAPTELPTTFVVQTTYPRELEPYDTTTGLVIGQVADPNRTAAEIMDSLTLSSTPQSAIYIQGVNLICIVTPDGSMEFMAFESASTGDGGATYTLANVWRGLMDTPAVKHLAGARGYFVSPLLVGRRGYTKPNNVDYIVIPHSATIGGSGGDPSGSLTIQARAWLPAPVADFRLAGSRMSGTTGVPAVADHFKSVSRVEESFELYGRKRLRSSSTLQKGNDADQPVTEFSPIDFIPYAYKLAGDGAADPQGYGRASTFNGVTTHVTGAVVGGVLLDGYGTIMVQGRTRRIIATGDPAIGQGGIAEGDTLLTWSPPTIAVVAPEWRNIMGNPRFDYAGGFTPWWVQSFCAVSMGTFGVTRRASAKWGGGSTIGNGTITQTVFVQSWLPRGMSAICWAHVRNLAGDVNDTISLRVDALDVSAASLANASAASPASVETNWRYREVAVAIPASTVSVKWSALFTRVGDNITLQSNCAVSESGISIGQIYNATLDLLTNGSFEAGATTSWTNASGTMTVIRTLAGPSDLYAQGGAFATSEIHQSFTLPAGYETGTYAVLRCWRMTAISGDTGTVKVEARDGASTVLLSSTTGAEALASTGEWYERVLVVDIPEGSVTVRVTLTATRAAGSGLSGACFDGIRLSLHKKLDPTREMMIPFSTAKAQPQPTTWQEYAITYPSIVAPFYVFDPIDLGSGFNEQATSGNKLAWSDGAEHPTGKMTGYWVASPYVDAFRFVRASGGSAVCVQAEEQAIDGMGGYTAATSFTVLCFFRVDELPWSGTACGLVGRRDLTSGWAIDIAAGGTLQAVIQGAAGTKTATVSGVVNDGAIHMVALVYNAVTQQLTCYSERGPGTPVSTASGLGEFYRQAETCRFRIGRSSSSIDTLPGMISRVFVFDAALGEDAIMSHWSYAKPPVVDETSLAYTRDAVAWAQVGSLAGSTYVGAFSVDQWGYAVEGSFGHGMAFARASTNRIPSWDFAGTSWVADVGVSLTQAIEDNTGKLSGVTAAVNATSGLKVIGLTATATTTMRLVFWARGTAGVGLTIELTNASDIVKNSQTITLADGWTRHVVAFTGWDNSTGTLRIRWRSTSGSATFSLGAIVWAQEGVDVPLLYQGPGASISDVTAIAANSFARQLNSEGEIDVIGTSIMATPAATSSIANLKNNSSSNNRRELTANSSGQAVLNHYNASASNTTSTGTAFDWRLAGASPNAWRLRGRWCRAMLLDNAVTPFAGIISDANVASAVYGRTATFTESTTQCETLEINKGASVGANVLIRSISVRARETKLV